MRGREDGREEELKCCAREEGREGTTTREAVGERAVT